MMDWIGSDQVPYKVSIKANFGSMAYKDLLYSTCKEPQMGVMVRNLIRVREGKKCKKCHLVGAKHNIAQYLVLHFVRFVL